MCTSFPREQFTNQCDRADLCVPMLLNQTEKDASLDNLIMRNHIEFTRQSLRPDDNLGVTVGMERTRAGGELFSVIEGEASSSSRERQPPSRSSRASKADTFTVQDFARSLPTDISRQPERGAGSRSRASKSFVPESHGSTCHQLPVSAKFPHKVVAASEIPSARASKSHSIAQGEVASAAAPTTQHAWCDPAGRNASHSTQAAGRVTPKDVSAKRQGEGTEAAARITPKDVNTKRQGEGAQPDSRADKLKHLLAIARGYPSDTGAAQNGSVTKRPATSAHRSKSRADSALDTAREDAAAMPFQAGAAPEALDKGVPTKEQNGVLRAGTPFPFKPSPKTSRVAVRQSKYMLRRVNSLPKKKHAPPKATGLSKKDDSCVSTVAALLSEKPMLIENLRRLGAPKMSKLRGKA